MNLLQEIGLSQEELQERVIERICEKCLEEPSWNEGGDEVGTKPSSFQKKLDQVIKTRINEAVTKIADNHVIPNAVGYVGNICFQETNPIVLTEPEKLVLEVSGPDGPFYETRHKQKAFIYWLGEDRIHGAVEAGQGFRRIMVCWQRNGNMNPLGEDSSDIVSLWTKPEPPAFDWSVAAKWMNWLAMDQNGEWWFFKDKPYIRVRSPIWVSADNRSTSALSPDNAPKWQGDWKESLVQRPDPTN